MRYRSEIDGLRALAIVAVILYHLGLGVPGGYVGVDVFFVISGFLISSLILSDLNRNQFSLVQFWERRARRIAPAMIVLVFAVLVAGYFILFAGDFKALGKATVFQSLFSANIYSYLDSGYFDGAAVEKPLLHTWSLAVEEQFYLLVPILLLFLYRYRKSLRKRFLALLLFLLMLVSLAISEFGMHVSPSASFFLLPSRAWELLVGSLLVVTPAGFLGVKNRLVREGLSALGLGCILVSCFTYTDKTAFPGLTALLPVVGTALIIHSHRREPSEAVDTWVGRLLSLRPIVFCGLLSYSLYLWHWPLVVMLRHLTIGPLGMDQKLLVLVLSGVAAYLSWKFVETPFRSKKVGAGKRIFVWTGAGLGVLAALGLGIVLGNGLANRFDQRVNSYVASKDDKSFRGELSVRDAKMGNFYPIGDLNAKEPTVFVWGDSHAMAAMAAFDAFLRDRNLRGAAATHSSTPPVLDWYYSSTWGLNSLAPAYNEAVAHYILGHGIQDVFLVGSWEGRTRSDSTVGGSFQEALVKTISLLRSKGARVYLMLDVPRTSIDVPKLLARSYLNHTDYGKYLATPQGLNSLDGFTEAQLGELTGAGAKVLNPKNDFLSPSGETYAVEKEGHALYFDNHHLSIQGAKLVYYPFLERVLEGDFPPQPLPIRR